VHLDSDALLRGWGVAVMHKMLAHEKLVFIDPFDRLRALCWHGSLNTLSQQESGELMTRQAGYAVISRYSEMIGLKDLLPIMPPEPKTTIFTWVAPVGSRFNPLVGRA